MPTRRIDSEIDRLYQLLPGEFTAARNALAKNAGTDAADVRRLAKPSVPAWAINQLYWKQRTDYDALVEAATELRKVHKAILGGRRGDIREASKAHDAAIDAALKNTLALLRKEGQPATDATRQAIVTTLRALPVDEPPGRLTHALQPGGFEMLAGLSVSPFRAKAEAAREKPETARGKAKPGTIKAQTKKEAAQKAPRTKHDAKALEQARDAASKAARELRAAEHDAQREEFEAARAAREADKAARAVERAREAVETARTELEEAEAAASAAADARKAAERRAHETERTRDAARARAEAADAALARMKND